MSCVDLFDAEVVCGCGRRYGIFEFVQLPLVGVQQVPAGSDGPAYALELRQCACHSVRAREVSEERAAWLEHRAASKALDKALRTKLFLREAFTAERRAWSHWMSVANASYLAARLADGRRAA